MSVNAIVPARRPGPARVGAFLVLLAAVACGLAIFSAWPWPAWPRGSALLRLSVRHVTAVVQAGPRQRPEDLARHRCLVFAEPRTTDELDFTRGRRTVRAKLNGVMVTNGGEALRLALVDGLGIGALPSFIARRDVLAGRIEPVLLDWTLPELRVFAVYPHRRLVSPKVRVFVDALRKAFGDGSRDPWWPEPPQLRRARA